MERDLEKDLAKILKKEKFQANMISYMSKVGKLLLFTLPVVLVVITNTYIIYGIERKHNIISNFLCNFGGLFF